MMAGAWTVPELLNGWQPVEHFSRPQYRMEGESLVFRGMAAASDYAFPAFQLPEEYSQFFGGPDVYDWGHMDEAHQLHQVKYTIDHEGFVYMEPQL